MGEVPGNSSGLALHGEGGCYEHAGQQHRREGCVHSVQSRTTFNHLSACKLSSPTAAPTLLHCSSAQVAQDPLALLPHDLLVVASHPVQLIVVQTPLSVMSQHTQLEHWDET